MEGRVERNPNPSVCVSTYTGLQRQADKRRLGEISNSGGSRLSVNRVE